MIPQTTQSPRREAVSESQPLSPSMAASSDLSSPSPRPASQPIALVALIIALASIALSALLVRLSEQELSPYAIAFNRFWITTLILSVWHVFHGAHRRLTEKPDSQTNETIVACTHACEVETLPTQPSRFSLHWGVGAQLFFAGTFLALDLTLWAWSLTQTSVANATLLANLTPLFTCLGGWLIWRRCFDKQFLMGLAIAVGGTLLLGISDLQVSAIKFQGDITALLAAVAFGVYLLILEQLQTRLSPTKIILGSSAIAAVIMIPLVLVTGSHWFPVSSHGWLMVISLALICQIMGQGLLVYSLHHLSSEFVSMVLLLDPLLAALGAWALFAERLKLLDGVAFAVVLLGIYFASTSQSALKESTDALPEAAIAIDPAPIRIESQTI